MAKFELAPDEAKEIVFVLGQAANDEVARMLAMRYRDPATAEQAYRENVHRWDEFLGTIEARTPDVGLNLLVNRWLPYQSLACRFWGRTALYQSGGAYGYRDQLQDCMSFVYGRPELARAHILRAASRQFLEGDAQHWWHPPGGKGVRTRYSDDYLFLPYVTAFYIEKSGDKSILDAAAPFIKSAQLAEGQDEDYGLPSVSEEVAPLYEHCVRAMDRAAPRGSHGLPLMGCGDWNDGMNLVGQHGKGESVWLAFFLYEVLNQFATLARKRDDIGTAERLELQAGRLRGNIEQSAWDGKWYRRAYFDDGTPLGSTENSECQIDSISQSWSVLSGAGTQERSVTAMESLYQRLVRSNEKLILLLDPPFDKSSLNPGYIKGYVPGVRENGGQYTHGAIWAVMAFAEMGETERAWELFSIINPIHHGSSPDSIAKYRVEPYVVAADVYGAEPHIGRGGWTWYTGSSGWMYRLIMESLLGVTLDVDKLRFNPRPPRDWPSFKIHYRFRKTFYHITKRGSSTGNSIKMLSIDGVEQLDHFVCLQDDEASHEVVLELG